MATHTVSAIVKAEDLGFFYELLGKYHEDSATFKAHFELLGHRRGGTTDEVPVERSTSRSPQGPKSLYKEIRNNCTCPAEVERCFGKFVRADYVPWRPLPDRPGHWINAKHGIVEVAPECALRESDMEGHYFVSHAEVKAFRSHTAEVADLAAKQQKTELAIRREEIALQDSLLEKEKKQKRFIREEAAEQSNFKAKLDRLEEQNNLEYERYNSNLKADYQHIIECGEDGLDAEWSGPNGECEFNIVLNRSILRNPRDKFSRIRDPKTTFTGELARMRKHCPFKFSQHEELQSLRQQAKQRGFNAAHRKEDRNSRSNSTPKMIRSRNNK